MSEDRVKYKKQVMVYVVRSHGGQFIKAFSSIKALHSYLNTWDGVKLSGGIAYQHLVKGLRTGTCFSLVMGELEHQVWPLPVDGKFIISYKRKREPIPYQLTHKIT